MTTTDPLLNRLFDRRYLIERKLGSGGMADVYLAEDQELGRRVALKLLDDRHAADEQFVERFRREAQNAAGLNHPNIVSIFDRGQAEGTYYIAMEFLDGRTLKELVVRNGPTPIPIAIDYARQILGALAFAHRHGIVHRDIKPHNIVVGRDGRLKVTDFGIARSGASQMTEAGSIVGTAQYLSPEQARGAQVDPRSDLYSLGIVIYEMLTGKVPFTGDAPVEIAMKHLSAMPEPPSKLRPEVPHDARRGRHARAREGPRRALRLGRGDGRRPRARRARPRRLAADRGGDDAGAGGADDADRRRRWSRGRATHAAGAARLPAARRATTRSAAAALAAGRGSSALLALAIAGGTGYLLYDQIQDQLNENRAGRGRRRRPAAGASRGRSSRRRASGARDQDRRASTVDDRLGDLRRTRPGASRAPKGSTVTILVSTGKPEVDRARRRAA